MWKNNYCIHLYGEESPTRFCSGPDEVEAFIEEAGDNVESVGVFRIEDDGECHGNCLMMCSPDGLLNPVHLEGLIDTACDFVKRGGTPFVRGTENPNKVTCPDCIEEQ